MPLPRSTGHKLVALCHQLVWLTVGRLTFCTLASTSGAWLGCAGFRARNSTRRNEWCVHDHDLYLVAHSSNGPADEGKNTSRGRSSTLPGDGATPSGIGVRNCRQGGQWSSVA